MKKCIFCMIFIKKRDFDEQMKFLYGFHEKCYFNEKMWFLIENQVSCMISMKRICLFVFFIKKCDFHERIDFLFQIVFFNDFDKKKLGFNIFYALCDVPMEICSKNMSFVETWRTSWHIMKKTRCSSNNCERHTKQQKTYYSQNLLEAMQNYENPCF